MKRYSDLWKDVIDAENGVQAIIDGTRFKRSQHEVQWLLYQNHYTVHKSMSINSRLGWASHCDSKNFIKYEIEPFVNVATARRMISDVDKDRKQ